MHPKGQKAPHGTASRYRKHKCRCEDCREAQRVVVAEYRLRKAGLGGEVPPKRQRIAKHGTRSGYKKCTDGTDGGKCEPCRTANREYQRVYMQDHRAGIKWGDWEDPAFAGW